MVPGIVLIILGAVFVFALKADASWLDTRAFGVILMLGGAAFIWRARARRRRVVVRETETQDGRIVSEQREVTDRRVE